MSNLCIGGQELGIDNVRFLADPVGDLNGDGFVGAGDLDLLLGQWNQKVEDEPADLNGDGFIGAGDLDLLLGNWNAGSAPATAVPEPTTLALLGLGVATTARRPKLQTGF